MLGQVKDHNGRDTSSHIFKHCLAADHHIVYYAKCPEKSCPQNYVGESSRRMLERVKDHNGSDSSSHIFKHWVAADHQFVSCDDLRIVGKITAILNGNGKLRKRY